MVEVISNINLNDINSIQQANRPKLKEEFKKVEEENNPVKRWINNLKNTKKNFEIVRASPYASLKISLKIRKWVIGIISIILLWMGYGIVKNYQAAGFMGIFGRVIQGGIIIYIIYMIYRTIPAAEKQLAYYQKYPHLINYCPTNVKQDVDEIISKIKENKIKEDIKREIPNTTTKK
jgi:hypothetical protein